MAQNMKYDIQADAAEAARLYHAQNRPLFNIIAAEPSTGSSGDAFKMLMMQASIPPTTDTLGNKLEKKTFFGRLFGW
jgi:hypothetical protein